MKEFFKQLFSKDDTEICTKRFSFLIILLMVVISDVVYLCNADFVSFNSFLLIHLGFISLIIGIVHFSEIKDLFK
jgi:hypothetical protein